MPVFNYAFGTNDPYAQVEANFIPNLQDFYDHPDKYAVDAFQIFGNLYYVGDQKVCSHLIDTGDGLILFDTGYRNTTHMMLHSIRSLGFDPMDIKYIIPKIIKKILNRPAINESVVDKTAKIDVGSVIFGSTLGRYSYLGEHTSLIKTTVGNFTCISNYCAIGGGQHPVDWVSMSPVFNSTKGIIKKKFAQLEYNPYQTTEIGNDVWIGSHCLIKAGVKISDGAVIGMGSVVTKDVGAYEIWAGNPAKLIKKRA